MSAGCKSERERERDPFEGIKELKDILELNEIGRLIIAEESLESPMSDEDAQNLKSLLGEKYDELGLDIPEEGTKVDLSISFSHILPKYKGKKSSRDGIKYPVTSLDLGIGWGCNYLYARVYDYENYDSYKMVNIGLNNHPRHIYLKFQGERKLAFAPVFLLVSDIIRSKIGSEKEE